MSISITVRVHNTALIISLYRYSIGILLFFLPLISSQNNQNSNERSPQESVQKTHQKIDGHTSYYLQFLNAIENSDFSTLNSMILKTPEIINMPNPDTGITPIHYAVNVNNADMVIALLKYQAYIDCQDGKNNTPLIKATQSKQSSIIKILLHHNANPHHQNKRGESAYALLAQYAKGNTKQARKFKSYKEYIENR